MVSNLTIGESNRMYDVKYAPYADEYMGMANGSAYEHLKRWLKRRILFTDSLYDYVPSYADSITIRANTTKEMRIEIETYAPVYQHMSWYNNQMDKKKIDGKSAVVFTGKAQASTDQEVLIYGGSNIKRIRGLSTMNPDSMVIGNASKLVELECNNAPLLTDINQNKANLSPNKYLTKVDISNCPLLGGTLRLNNSPLLSEVNAQGTAITGMLLPTSIKNLQTLKVPKGVTELTLNDAKTLTTLDLEEGYLLNTLSLSNCNKLKSFDLSKVENINLDNSYDAEELRLSTNKKVSLKNMASLERLVYIPNSEVEEFDLVTLKNSGDYSVSVFNCPKLKEFITTAPQRESYGECGAEIYPYKLFMANKLDLSGTQVNTIKFLCTTDIFDLKLPSTLKNFYCDSAFDLDKTKITDGDYDVIHSDLIKPYTEEYNENVYLYKHSVLDFDKAGSNKTLGTLGGGTSAWIATSDFIPIKSSSSFTFRTYEAETSVAVSGYDKNKQVVKSYISFNNGILKPAQTWNFTISDDVYYIRIQGGFTYKQTLEGEFAWNPPNIVPTSANGSLLFNINTSPTSISPYIWDLQGMKLNDFHTYGVNNRIKISEDNSITMPKRLADYKVQIKNADITPNQYNTMLYPKLVDTTLPITGKLDYSKYKGKYLSWAFAYTTNDVVRTALDSRSQGQIINDYKKLEGTEYVDIVDVWAYKGDDFTSRANNSNITKAYIELTQDNYKTRIDEVLQWYPNCTELHLFEDGSVTSLAYMIGMENSNSGNPNSRAKVKVITFMEGYFENTTSAYAMCKDFKVLERIYNIPNNITEMGRCFNGCVKLTYISNFPSSMKNAFGLVDNCNIIKKIPEIPNAVTNLESAFNSCYALNQEFDLSSCINIVSGKLSYAWCDCSSLTYIPILPSNYKGSLQSAFTRTKITTAPVLPDGVTSLNSAFQNCTELTTVGNIPSSCNNYNSTFRGCTKLTSVPESGWNGDMGFTFYNCKILNQKIMIESATVLESTFFGCSALSITPTLPEVATNASMDSTFWECTSLVYPSKTPSGITSLCNCYRGCTNLAEAPIIPNNVGNILNLVYYSKITNITIPLDVIDSYNNALGTCTQLTDITWTGKRKTDFSLTALGTPSYTQEDIQELVQEHLEDLYKDKIKISYGTKVTINNTETSFTTTTSEE